MATQKLPFFLQNPERDHCAGRMLSLAHSLKQEGYKGRNIKFAALETAFKYAQEEEFNEYRNFLLHVQDMVKRDLADLDDCASDEERERLVAEYNESLL
jgi:hypothetical protein